MKTKTAVVSVLLVSALTAALELALSFKGMRTGRTLDLVFGVGVTVVSYLWYRRDSLERRYVGSSLMAAGIILCTVIGVPVYLARSRPAGQKLEAVFSFFGVVLACILVMLAVALSLEVAR